MDDSFFIVEYPDDPKYAESRRQVKDETWEYAGQGAVRAADYLIGKYDELNSGKGGTK